MRRLLSLLSIGLAMGVSGPANAQTVARCALTPATPDMQTFSPSDARKRFAQLSNGAVAVGMAQRVMVGVTGCDPSAHYTLDFGGRGITVERQGQGTSRSIQVIPVIVSVNGAPAGGYIGPVEMTGNPMLELVFAIADGDLAVDLPAGSYRGLGAIAQFRDK